MKHSKDNLGDRMKQYENCHKHTLPGRLPVIIRCDGKAFHTYTKPLKRDKEPCNSKLEEVMNLAAVELCKEIQGAQFAYVQSDEISILVHGYKRFTSQSWFNNELVKMVSVSAGIASAIFTAESWRIWQKSYLEMDSSPSQFIRPAYFDSRAFVLPEQEVCNYFIWRLKDCQRNSVSMYAQHHFSHKLLHKKSNREKIEMLKTVGCVWESLPSNNKNGRIVLRENDENGHKQWKVINDFPLFWEERNFIEKFLKCED